MTMGPDEVRSLAVKAGLDPDKRLARIALADAIGVSERTIDLYLEGKRQPSKPVQKVMRHLAAGGTLKGQE